MSASLYLDGAKSLAEACLAREVSRHGVNREIARNRLASRLGWPPGTLYNLLRDRLKKLDGDLREQLTAYAIKDLKHEIEGLTRELENAERLGRSQDPSLVCKAAAVLAEAQSLHARLAGEVAR